VVFVNLARPRQSHHWVRKSAQSWPAMKSWSHQLTLGAGSATCGLPCNGRAYGKRCRPWSLGQRAATSRPPRVVHCVAYGRHAGRQIMGAHHKPFEVKLNSTNSGGLGSHC
jgi:hypothetical protein